MALARWNLAPTDFDKGTATCKTFYVAADIFALSVLHDPDKLVVDDRRAFEQPEARGYQVGCAGIVPPRDELLPKERQRHLAPEWLGRYQRVDDEVPRDDPLIKKGQGNGHVSKTQVRAKIPCRRVRA